MLLRGPVGVEPTLVPEPPFSPPWGPPDPPPPPSFPPPPPPGADPLGRPDLLSRATLPTDTAPPSPREAAGGRKFFGLTWISQSKYGFLRLQKALLDCYCRVEGNYGCKILAGVTSSKRGCALGYDANQALTFRSRAQLLQQYSEMQSYTYLQNAIQNTCVHVDPSCVTGRL